MTENSPLDPALNAGDTVRIDADLELSRIVHEQVPGLAAAMAGMEPWQGLGFGIQGLTRYWLRADPGAVRLGFHSESRLCAAICVRPRWLRGAFLELMCVLPRAQGRGYGRRIVEWLAREATALGPNLWTSTGAGNARALSFYRSAGFVEAAVLPDLLAPGCDEILLRRALGKEEAVRSG